MSAETPEKTVPWSLVQWAIALLVPLLISLGVSYGAYQVHAYRVDAAEKHIAEIRADIVSLRAKDEATDALIRDVAQDMRLFLCSQDKIFCKPSSSP